MFLQTCFKKLSVELWVNIPKMFCLSFRSGPRPHPEDVVASLRHYSRLTRTHTTKSNARHVAQSIRII